MIQTNAIQFMCSFIRLASLSNFPTKDWCNWYLTQLHFWNFLLQTKETYEDMTTVAARGRNGQGTTHFYLWVSTWYVCFGYVALGSQRHFCGLDFIQS